VSDVKPVKQNRFTCRVSEEHHETVNTDAPATRWRKAMFKTGTVPIEYMYPNQEKVILTHQRKSRRRLALRRHLVPSVSLAPRSAPVARMGHSTQCMHCKTPSHT
jgi:hypothetical protein